MSERTPHIPPTRSASGSLTSDYFDQLYAASADPWEFATSRYEAEKYAATLAALPRPPYASALELGCSIGVLTRQLAVHCDRLLAIDISEAALNQARERCADLPHVRFEQRDMAAEFPAGRFDLVLVSEVGYYLASGDLERLRDRIAHALAPHGHLLLVHYTGETNYPLSGDAVHDCFRAHTTRWRLVQSRAGTQYRLDLFEAR